MIKNRIAQAVSPPLVLMGIASTTLFGCAIDAQSDQYTDVDQTQQALDASVTYTFRNVNAGKCLDVTDVSKENGANIQLWDCTEQAGQQFTLVPSDSGYVSLRNVNSGKCLDVWGWSTAAGANIAQYSCTGSANQQFRVEDVGGGNVRFVSRHSGKALDAWAKGTANGTNIAQWEPNGGTNQTFVPTKVGGSSPPTSPPSTGECTNVRPTGTDWDAATCNDWAQQTSECQAGWMIDNHYCDQSCGRCSGGDNTGDSPTTCALPNSYSWTSSGPLTQPANNSWNALKDFSVTKYNGKYIVFGTVANGGWNGFFSTFESFDEWRSAPQNYHAGHVAPTIFYFAPKDIWVLAYQWGFQYKTTKTPDVWSSWSAGKSLLNTNPDPTNGAGTGPIDQTIICDDKNCFLFFNDDAGGVYRASMPIGQFPAQFSNAQKIMQQSTGVIFEGVQVYSVKGSNKYLMIIENNGTRAFRAWTATDLGGSWTSLSGANSTNTPFAGQANTTWPGGQWTDDISHGDIVRENPSQKMEIDPCHLQLLYQGRDPHANPPPPDTYGKLPYRPGLLTLTRRDD